VNFVAIDVETANPDLASICQVGVVVFGPAGPVRTWKSLIDPEDDFSDVNVSIHGIDAAAVRGAPRFGDVFEPLRALLDGRIVVSHTAFDRVSIARAAARYSLPSLDCRWLDTARVARRAWDRFSKTGYGLANIAAWCGISFTHHRAEKDARAAGEILLRAIADTGIPLEEWVVRSTQPISGSSEGSSGSIMRDGNPTGPLAGEVVVFTGALTIPRRQAADMAAACGCDVAASVKKNTTLLVVGDQDVRRLAGHEQSSKHRKAEALIADGQPIRILGESDFLRMVEAR
jgi:DNA polymerase-3 subunit epsilon